MSPYLQMEEQNYGPEGPPPDSARAATTDVMERVRRGSVFDIDV